MINHLLEKSSEMIALTSEQVDCLPHVQIKNLKSIKDLLKESIHE